MVAKASEQLREVMDRDYAGIIKKKLDDVYRTGGTGSTARGEKESRQGFIVRTFSTCELIADVDSVVQILLNDLDVSSSHMERLIKDLAASEAISQYFLDSEAEGVRGSISAFTSLVPRFRSTLRVRRRIFTTAPRVCADVQ